MRDRILSLILTVISRGIFRRDRHNGKMKRIVDAFSFADQRFILQSGGRRLSAVYVSAGTDAPAILICHGIGEVVEYWGRVQEAFKRMGVSSLVFNYSGCAAIDCPAGIFSRDWDQLRGGFARRCARADFVRSIFNVSRRRNGDWLPAMADAHRSRCMEHGRSCL